MVGDITASPARNHDDFSQIKAQIQSICEFIAKEGPWQNISARRAKQALAILKK
jgi:hypothetical protein